jgi:hypothetical protein
MFDRAAALGRLQAGKCACGDCPGELTDAALSQGDWRFCRNCRCAWKVSTINGQAYATSIHAPLHAPVPAQPRKDGPGHSSPAS